VRVQFVPFPALLIVIDVDDARKVIAPCPAVGSRVSRVSAVQKVSFVHVNSGRREAVAGDMVSKKAENKFEEAVHLLAGFESERCQSQTPGNL
jgi:hypothetical protein